MDTTHGSSQKLEIYLNITFPALSCDVLSLDVMDVSGEHQVEVEHSFFKTRLQLDGKAIQDSTIQDIIDPSKNDELKSKVEKIQKEGYCGSCYGANSSESQCCNTCAEIREAYRKKGWVFHPGDDVEQCLQEILERKTKLAKHEGCNLFGHFLVNKVAGNFHFAPGKTIQYARAQIRDYTPEDIEHYNTSHIIHKLSFGLPYPGALNPLDDVSKVVTSGSALYQYFIKVVPTVYEYASGKNIRTNQYSVTQHIRNRDSPNSSVIPGVFFMFDLSPIMMSIKEERKSFLHFLTSLCAIIGGVITVSGIADSLVHYYVSKKQKQAYTLS